VRFANAKVRKLEALGHIHRYAAAVRAATFVRPPDDYALPLPEMLKHVEETVVHKLVH